MSPLFHQSYIEKIKPLSMDQPKNLKYLFFYSAVLSLYESLAARYSNIALKFS